ncbi:MAG: DUF1211 domain-containing protein [Chloroflexi bacterium]|nr:MAG: DUF1211 domain-containing protein [Chloroflexota bacterium]
MSKNRVEAFSDGVFAVAITILVFNLQVPSGLAHGALWSTLGALWPSYATYIASFLTIGVMWMNHHGVFRRLRAVDRNLQLLNLLLLLTVVFVPFPTALLGRFIPAGGDDAAAAATLYALTSIGIGASFSSIWIYALYRPELLAPGLDPDLVRRRLPLFSAGPVVYLACLVVAHYSPILVAVLCGMVAVYYFWDWLPEARPAYALPEARPSHPSERVGGGEAGGVEGRVEPGHGADE